MSMTIRQKLAALTITSALAASILGCLGLWGARKIEDTTEQINVGLHAISNHMESDMMHDALRGDVLAALYYAAIAPQRRSELESEARDHAQNFRAKMAANRELEMSAQVRAELAKAEPILELYIDSAERLVSLAFDSHERAAAELAAFSERFSLLETSMEEIATLIERESSAQIAENASFYGQIRSTLLIGVALAIATIALVGFSIARQIGLGVRSLTAAARGAAAGNLRSRADARQQNELGELAGAFNQVVEHLGTTLISISQSTDALGHAAENLQGMSGSMIHDAESANAQVGRCSLAAEDVSTRTQSASSAAGQFSASIQEIAQSAARGASVASQAVQVAGETQQIVSKLAESSTSIETILGTINTIAEQTNMLALNATIEAARAGDAGKGFAVVANEVKELAKQTGKATGQIARTIDEIRSDSQNAKNAIAQIQTIIEHMNSSQVTIAAAVEEQTATTNEIAGSISSAAEGSARIVQSIGEVSQTAENAAQSGRRAGAEAKRLAEIAAQFQGLMAKFQYERRVEPPRQS